MGKVHPILQAYIPLVQSLSQIIGDNCEVVLHDVSNLEKSIICIANNHITGRKEGGPLTDLGIRLLKEKVHEKQDSLLNYKTKTKDGRPMRSSTIFIKDEMGKLLGMLCINIDLTAPLTAKKFIDNYIGILPQGSPSMSSIYNNDEFENFAGNLEELIDNLINTILGKLQIPADLANKEDKLRLVRELEEKGIFKIKGSVAKVAKKLRVSVNTVYRYLNQIRVESEEEIF